MQHATPVPTLPQFASLSLLTVDGMAEPMIAVAPTAMCTCNAAIDAIREMSCYIKNVLISHTNTESQKKNDFTSELLSEDVSILLHQQQSVQVYRPLSINGMAIHYRYLDGSNRSSEIAAIVMKLQSLILTSNGTSKTNVVDPSSKILGIVICVAMTGPTIIYTASPLSYTINQRIDDCILFLKKELLQVPNANMNITSIKELLTLYLLIDDEHRVQNRMMLPSPNSVTPITAATDYIHLPYVADDKSRTALLFSPLSRMTTPIVGLNKAARRASTGIVRNVMMNVGNNSSISTGNLTATSSSNTAAGSSPMEMGFSLQLRPNSADAARSMIDRLTILSVTEQSTFLRKYEHSGQERKANFDLTGGASGTSTKNRFRRVRRNDTTRDADFDHFDYKGPIISAATMSMMTPSTGAPATTLSSTESTKPNNKTVTPNAIRTNPEPSSQGKLLFKSSAKDTKKGPSSRRPTASMISSPATNGDSMSSQQQQRQQQSTKLSERITSRASTVKMEIDDVTNDSKSLSGHQDATSVFSNDNKLTQQQKSPSTKFQVNIALNEDLSCSYKLSQLSSCSVDGIVQVQLKSSVPTRTNIPFILLLNDPMGHIESLNENTKFATKVNASSYDSFNVVIPEQEKYYSLLKYRCKDDLRPVPIRVQAKVKSDGHFCRVALQISSNPNNESGLTDLSIVMGVPTRVVDGTSVVTQPPGGVWDPSKSSVIWHVSELDSGEKFQLQARFEVIDQNTSSPDLNFPVMVRCQCLHVQLSGISFDIKQQPTLNPAEMTMKVASRFRLSHREKNS